MASGLMIAFDPFTAEDYQALFDKHAWTDRSEVDIDQYLTPQERVEMCDYEKDRLRNIKKNYDVMVDMGLPAKKPYFMMKNRPKFLQPVIDSSESDGEWIPASRRKSKKQSINAGWKPPLKTKTEGTPKKVVTESSKASVKGKPTKAKAKGKSRSGTAKEKAPKPAGNTKGSSQKLPVMSDSDSDEPEFHGFSAAEISANEAWTAEIVSRNDDILKAIEAGTYDFELSDDEGDSEEESADSKTAEVLPEPSAKPEPDKASRYPRRSIARKVYTEPDVPKDDDFLYCEECDHDYEGDCPVHGPLLIIPDTVVANDGSDPERAVHSLPKGLIVRKSQIPMAGDGVWAESPVCKGARFGPYEGLKMDDKDEAHKSGYCWVIYKDGNEVSHYVDAGDKSQANWLRYVNCARNEAEQNLLAYQYQGEVYYRTVHEVRVGQELLVWYGDEYGRELGLLQGEGSKVQQLFHNAGFEVFTCEVCGRMFPSETWRDGHRRQHGDRTGSKRYTCTQCNFSTDNSGNYNSHLRTHSGERPYTCNVCGKGFTQSQSLTRHQRIHTGDKPYKCDVCGRRFTMSQHLQRHTRTHTGETPYTCPVCGQGFNHSISLSGHMSKHTGVLPYVCQTCGHGCTTAQDLTRHMRTHTGERPYVCTTCGHGFTTSSHLKRHTYTHTGAWPHTCSHCGKGFATPSDLKTHIEKNHRH